MPFSELELIGRPDRLVVSMQLLPGFRDFYPEDCARRNYIIATWREVARRYGFVEFDGPMLETVELYKKKSGGELVGQLFDFTDKGERHVTLRPEMTPTLARMIIARERDYKKPIKWFCAPQFFRYEKQQKGRLREFCQFNADIIGEASPAADAEMIGLVIDLLRGFGFTKNDFIIRLSSRDVWLSFLLERSTENIRGHAHQCVNDAQFARFLAILDKIERQDEQTTNTQLGEFNATVSDLRAWISGTRNNLLNPNHDPSWFSGTTLARLHELLHNYLAPLGLLDFIDVDFTIVRGLAYYTGVVFEVFDRSKNERAIAGGGRYDKLLSLMSDGKTDLPALGFGMGDVVLANLINSTPHAKAKMDTWIAQHHACDVYVIIANEARRIDALGLVQQLRGAGFRIDYPLSEAKVGKQFQAAEQAGARFAVVIGDEWPQIKLKTLATREESLVALDELPARLGSTALTPHNLPGLLAS